MNEHECENCDIVIVGDKDRKLCFYCQMAADDKTAQAKTTAYEARIAELEAENAELKDRYNNRITQDIKDWSLITELRSMLDVAYGQSLTKALEAKLADLAAANAALDRLREVVRSDDDEWQDWEPGDLMRLASAVHAILYPTPENDNDIHGDE